MFDFSVTSNVIKKLCNIVCNFHLIFLLGFFVMAIYLSCINMSVFLVQTKILCLIWNGSLAKKYYVQQNVFRFCDILSNINYVALKDICIIIIIGLFFTNIVI